MENTKEIAVIVCNFNKRDYLERCLISLVNQVEKNFDIYVVDNASTDGSSEMVEEQFRDIVYLIKNAENLGGAGGFNTGMRHASEKGYKYLVLLDNDVVLADNCLITMYDDMENNKDIGIMGAKILKMDEPDIIQEFAPTISFNDMNFRLHHKGEKDTQELPHIMFCDYVPACALIVRGDVVDKIGVMPEEYYIYYDDISWATKCRRAGYRVAADSKAVVWHKGGAKANPTTFGTYYLTRNKILYFMQNADMFSNQENKEVVSDKIMHEIFESVYTCLNNGMPNIAKTRFDAFLDALEFKHGKALPQRICPKEDNKKRLRELLRGKNHVLLYTNGQVETTRSILNDINEQVDNDMGTIEIELLDKNCDSRVSIMGYEVRKRSLHEMDHYDLVLHVCHHIYEINIDSLDRIWIDRFANILSTEGDFEAYSMFDKFYGMFSILFKQRIMDAISVSFIEQ